MFGWRIISPILRVVYLIVCGAAGVVTVILGIATSHGGKAIVLVVIGVVAILAAVQALYDYIGLFGYFPYAPRDIAHRDLKNLYDAIGRQIGDYDHRKDN